jgi:hypothetical protein
LNSDRVSRSPIRWWLWPNVLSLDAPLIAVVWDLFFARCFHAHVRLVAVLTLALWVWVIYAADRVLDSLRLPASPNETPRHQFYRRYRTRVVPLIAIASIGALWLSFDQLRTRLLIYGLPLGFLMAGYFAIVHLGSRAVRDLWPKELMVALLFGVGALLPVYANLPRRSGLAAPFLLLVGILWINAIAIERWEADSAIDRPRHRVNLLTRWLGDHLGESSLIVGLLALASATRAGGEARQIVVYAALALSAIALAILASQRLQFSRDALRVLADAALLTPLCFLPFLR